MSNLKQLLHFVERKSLRLLKQRPIYLARKYRPGQNRRPYIAIKQKLQNIWDKYLKFLDDYGWKAQALNTSVLVGLGDVLSQTIVLGRWNWESFDKSECARYFAVGLLILGPIMYVWYFGLDVIITSTGLGAAVKKMLMDQILFLPIYVAGMIEIMGLLCQEPWEKIHADITNDFVPIMKYCYLGWPWIQVLNFYYVPLKLRIMVMNVVGLFYNTLIAWKIEQRRHAEQALKWKNANQRLSNSESSFKETTPLQT